VSLAPLLRGEAERLPERMLVIQFSRMNAPRPQKGDACVLWRRWRLIGDRELYDVESDPAQERDVAGEHADVVAKMRAHYEAWWSGVEPRLDQFEPVAIGSDHENPTLLSPCEWADVFLDQSAQVRRGEPKNGVWHIAIAQEGEYEISLRRWPEETGASITAALPEYKAADGVYPPGAALPIARARIQVQDFDQASPVGPEDKAVLFTTRLRPGPAKLQTWFLNAEGSAICGAYYVSVRRK
jgi:hypothetical protein